MQADGVFALFAADSFARYPRLQVSGGSLIWDAIRLPPVTLCGVIMPSSGIALKPALSILDTYSANDSADSDFRTDFSTGVNRVLTHASNADRETGCCALCWGELL